MNSVLVSLIAFAVALGILIAVHEFGHFWVARRAGVKVLRFSIGFGRPLWSRRFGRDQTEFVISALPLGGYVKMLDEREAPVAEHELARAFNRQSVGKRIAVVAAGPAFNFLFAIAAYWLIFVVGVSGLRPIIGEVIPGSIADQAGLRAGQHIVAVEGRATPTWSAALEAMLPRIIEQRSLHLELEDERTGRLSRVLDLSEVQLTANGADPLRTLGLRPYRPAVEPVIGELMRDGAGERAGLAAGDRITHVDGRRVNDWREVVDYVAARPETPVTLTVARTGRAVSLEVVPERVVSDGQEIGRIGVVVRMPESFPEELTATHRESPLPAIGAAVARTWEMSALTVRMLVRMVLGQASVEHLSGPISIAQYAGQTASIGAVQFIAFLAIVSISLGILNLLPIPLLDGGHLMYYAVEVVKGSPVSEQAQVLGQKVGLALLLGIMALAFYNDLARLFS